MTTTDSAWHREVLPDGWERVANLLASRGLLDECYLAGGTGLALQFGHRRSIDLDLFRETDFDSATMRDRLRGLDTLRNLELAPSTLYFELHGIKISVIRYPYPLLFPLLQFGPLAVSDARDTACMKLDALANRGSRRDFVDIYEAAQRFGLVSILEWFGEKFASVGYNRVHILKALCYFADAEGEPMPEVLNALRWDQVTRYFEDVVPRMPSVQ